MKSAVREEVVGKAGWQALLSRLPARGMGASQSHLVIPSPQEEDEEGTVQLVSQEGDNFQVRRAQKRTAKGVVGLLSGTSNPAVHSRARRRSGAPFWQIRCKHALGGCVDMRVTGKGRTRPDLAPGFHDSSCGLALVSGGAQGRQDVGTREDHAAW